MLGLSREFSKYFMTIKNFLDFLPDVYNIQ